MKKTIKKIFLLAAVLTFIINIVVPIVSNWNKFTEKFNIKLYEKKYNQSQYMVPQSKNPISDEELLSYAGYKYITGTNPILINSDHPPLGKYIIGFFTVLFNNNRVVSLFFGLGNIFLIAIIINYLTRSLALVFAGLTMLFLDSMFIDQIIGSPILDIIQVFFLLLYFYLFFIYQKTKKLLIIFFLGLVLGSLASIKLYFPALILLTVSLLTMILNRKNLKQVFVFGSVIFLLAFFVYAATYSVYFLKGNTFRSFLGVQKWIFLFWKNNSIDTPKYYGSVIPLLLFNAWKVWWGDQQYIKYVNWTIFWPIFFILGLSSSLLTVVKYLTAIKKRKNINQENIFISLWVVFFTAYLCLLPISPRYLMMLFFPLYIIITLVLGDFIEIRPKRKIAHGTPRAYTTEEFREGG